MKIKVYRNMKTNEIVPKDEAEEYMKDKLKVSITPDGKGGSLTQEQVEYICASIDWLFSGEWIDEEIEKEKLVMGV